MDLKDLRYFRMIAQCGSFSKAAAHLRVAQPALSRKIQKLEHGLGVKLLRRAARGITPTDAGQILLQRTIKFEHEIDEMRREIARFAENAIGVLRVAIQSPLSLVIVPDLVRAYQISHPGVTLELTEGFSGDLIDGLLQEQIDLAIVDAPSHPHADLNCAPLWVETLRLVGPAGGLIAERYAKEPVPVPELSKLPIIMPCQKHAVRRLVDAAFERHHLRFQPAIEANGSLMILQLVKAGFGYTVLSSNGVYPWVASGELETARVHPSIRRTMSIVTRTAVLNEPMVASFRSLVKAIAPGVAGKKRFGPAALYLTDRMEKPLSAAAAMPARHGARADKALASRQPST